MKPQLILVAGPYPGGTDGEPVRIMKNLHRLELHRPDICGTHEALAGHCGACATGSGVVGCAGDGPLAGAGTLICSA